MLFQIATMAIFVPATPAMLRQAFVPGLLLLVAAVSTRIATMVRLVRRMCATCPPISAPIHHFRLVVVMESVKWVRAAPLVHRIVFLASTTMRHGVAMVFVKWAMAKTASTALMIAEESSWDYCACDIAAVTVAVRILLAVPPSVRTLDTNVRRLQAQAFLIAVVMVYVTTVNILAIAPTTVVETKFATMA